MNKTQESYIDSNDQVFYIRFKIREHLASTKIQGPSLESCRAPAPMMPTPKYINNHMISQQQEPNSDTLIY